MDNYLKLNGEKAFNLCVEINSPHDPNKTFTDPHLGQPSLLYTGHIKADDPTLYHILELTGHGATAIKDGSINYDLDPITTAKDLLDIALIKVQPVEKK